MNHGPILVGSTGPIPIDPETWVARLESREVKRYLGFASAGTEEILWSAEPLVTDGVTEEMLNADLFPRDELLLSRTPGETSAEPASGPEP